MHLAKKATARFSTLVYYSKVKDLGSVPKTTDFALTQNQELVSSLFTPEEGSRSFLLQ